MEKKGWKASNLMQWHHFLPTPVNNNWRSFLGEKKRKSVSLKKRSIAVLWSLLFHWDLSQQEPSFIHHWHFLLCLALFIALGHFYGRGTNRLLKISNLASMFLIPLLFLPCFWLAISGWLPWLTPFKEGGLQKISSTEQAVFWASLRIALCRIENLDQIRINQRLKVAPTLVKMRSKERMRLVQSAPHTQILPPLTRERAPT